MTASLIDLYFFFDNLFLCSMWRCFLCVARRCDAMPRRDVLLPEPCYRWGSVLLVPPVPHRTAGAFLIINYLVFIHLFQYCDEEVDHLVDYEILFVIVFKWYAVERIVIFWFVIFVLVTSMTEFYNRIVKLLSAVY